MNKITGILLLLLYICVGTALLNERFVDVVNMQNNIRWTALFGIIGIGVAFVIITGGIDLSIGSVIGLIGCLLAMSLVDWGWSVPAALAFIALIALLIGLYHGVLITKLRLQPFVVTLCGLLYFRGLARWITNDQTKGFGTEYADTLGLLADGKPCSIAMLMLLCGAALTAWCGWRFLRAANKTSRIGENPPPTSRSRNVLSGALIAANKTSRIGENPPPTSRSPDVLSGALREDDEGDVVARRTKWAVGALIGVGLITIGGSRYRYGWDIEPGEPLVTLGPLALPTWSADIPEAAVGLPQLLMQWSAVVAIPGVIWLAVVLFQGREQNLPDRRKRSAHEQVAGCSVRRSRSGRWWKSILPVAAMAVGVGLVRWAMLLVDAPDEWFRPDASWARTWRMLSVFGTLGVLMAAIAWFLRSAREIAGRRALAPLLLTGSAVVLWLAGQTKLGQLLVPAPMIILIVIGVMASVFLNQTIYGRYLLALGRNEEAARFSGINTQRMIVLAYVLCALAAGLGGILFSLDLNSIQPSGHGNFYELYAIAAAVLGGCSLRGGEGTIVGVVIGAAVMQVLRNSISMVGLPSNREQLIIGLVILLGVMADEIMKRLAARRKGASLAGEGR